MTHALKLPPAIYSNDVARTPHLRAIHAETPRLVGCARQEGGTRHESGADVEAERFVTARLQPYGQIQPEDLLKSKQDASVFTITEMNSSTATGPQRSALGRFRE